MNKPNFGRRFKYGSMAAIFSVIVIVAILVVNVGATLLTDRLGLSVDMTSDGRFDISEDTYELVRGLEDKVYIYVMATEAQLRMHSIYSAEGYPIAAYGNEIVEVLNRYPVISNGMVSVEYVDVATNPQFLNRFDGIGEIAPFTLIISNDKGSFRTIPLYQLYYWYYSFEESYQESHPPVGIHVERSIASGILYLDEEEQRTAVFLSGHGEPTDLMAFSDFLRLNNFECLSVNLETADLPEGTDLVIIVAPSLDYTEGMIAKLEKYLKDPDVDLFVALSPANGELEELQRFISDYGITITNNTVFDTKVSAGATNISGILSSDEEMFANMPYDSNVILPFSLQLELNEGRPTAFASRPVMTSSDSSFARPNADISASVIIKGDGDTDGPFNVACVSEYSTYSMEDYKQHTNKILVLGSAYCMYDEFFNSSKYSNEEFFTCILNDFFELPDLTRFEGNEFTTPEIVLLNWEKTFVLSVLCIIPAALLFAGIFVWFRRKNK